MRISPSSGIPPWICSLSTSGTSRLTRALVLIRRIHLQGERVDFIAHQGSEGLVYELMPLYRAQTRETRSDHHRFEMHVVLARNRRAAVWKTPLNELGDLLWIHALSSSCIIRRWTLTTRMQASSNSGVPPSPSKSTACVRSSPAWDTSLHSLAGFVLPAAAASSSPGGGSRGTSAASVPPRSRARVPRRF